MTRPPPPRVSVVIITYARPQFLTTCLEHLGALRTPPHEILVVDASPDDRSRTLVAEKFPDVVYLRNDLGPGTMPESRQIGLARATGEIISFIDDDAYVDELWLDALTSPYADPSVSAVGGRAVNALPGEESEGLGSIGRLLPNGDLTGYFGADPGHQIDVDHLLGANMSFRVSALTSIGGIRGNYPGTCLCEESDISLRLGAAGHRLVFAPQAIVRHVAAPYQSGGQRFDRRYLYYSRRNHLMLLARVFGWSHPLVRRYAVTTVRDQQDYLRTTYRLLRGRPDVDGHLPTRTRRLTSPIILTRSACELAGLVAGVPAALRARHQDRAAGVSTP